MAGDGGTLPQMKRSGLSEGLAKCAHRGQCGRVARLVENEDLAVRYSRAFPSSMRSVVAGEFRAVLPQPDRGPLGEIEIHDYDGVSHIPYRIYNPPVAIADSPSDPTSRLLLDCLYSRHHDGFVRQQAVNRLIKHPVPWIVPFVVEVIGEYVIEIIEDLTAGLVLDPGTRSADVYGRFVDANGHRMEKVAQRAISYWNCYHRFRYPVLRPRPNSEFATYPAFVMLDRLRSIPRT